MRKFVVVLMLVVFLPVIGCNTMKTISMGKSSVMNVVETTLLEYVPQAQVIVAEIQADYAEMLTMIGKTPNPEVMEYFAAADTLLALLAQFLDQVKKGEKVTLTAPQIANLVILGQKVLKLKSKLLNK